MSEGCSWPRELWFSIIQLYSNLCPDLFVTGEMGNLIGSYTSSSSSSSPSSVGRRGGRKRGREEGRGEGDPEEVEELSPRR